MFILLATNSILAQYGNNRYGNSYGSGNRMNQMNSSMNQDSHRETQKVIPTEVTVGKIVEKLKIELTLDELQVVAISNILTESINKQNSIIKAESSQEDKLKEIKALSDITDMKILELLYKTQKDKYKALKEEQKIKADTETAKRNR